MRSLPKPNFDARSTFELCANNVRDQNLSDRLMSIINEIEAAEASYVQHALAASLYTIATAEGVDGVVTTKEMKKLYKGTFARKNSIPRKIYDEIRTASPNGICPLCGHREVSTLDHYLAQSLHPSLTVSPLNLVPACSECNKSKLDKQPKSSAEQTLHPYFDEVGEVVWLKATLVEGEPPALLFLPAPPEVLPEKMRVRLCYHFQLLSLGGLYATHAAVELVNIHFSLMRTAERGGADGIRAHLVEQATSRRNVEINSWQSAMYDALANSDWFCREGYQLIS